VSTEINQSEPVRIRVGSLADLEVIETEIELRRPDGACLLVPVRSLTPAELAAERRAIKWPTPPQILLATATTTKGGRPQMVPNYDDEGYKTAREDATQQYAYRVVVRCLVKGGVSVPGETAEEQVAALEERIGAWALRGLSEGLGPLHGATPEDIDAAGKA